MNKKRKTCSVYLYNPIEDEWDFISSFKKNQQKKLIHDSNRFADCYLFANALLPAFILISPIAIDNNFKEYFELLADSQATILMPKERTPFISQNSILDKNIFSELVAQGKKWGSLTLYVYSVTKNVFLLKKALERSGVTVFLPEAPLEKNLKTVAHFGSKAGFRSSFSSLMPKGSIVKNEKEVIQKAIKLFSESTHGIVLKTDKGNAGQGVHILRKSDIVSSDRLTELLQKIYKDEPFLKKHPIILESYIDTSKERRCPLPSVECFIHQNGRIEIPYYCNMIVTPEGEFYGMEMHEGVLSSKVKKSVLSITKTIARKMRDMGYRGRFDIDMMNDGKNIFANEANTRINGGTDTYLMTRKLVGKDIFSKRYVISNYIDMKSKVSFLRAKEVLSPYLFNKRAKIGLIINSASVLNNGGFSYILVGKNRKNTTMLNEEIISIMDKLV